MKFVKGQSGNPAGKPKGPHKATARLKEALTRFTDDNADRLQGWLDEIAERDGPQAAFKCFSDLIEYSMPKLARTELTGRDGAPMETVTRVELAPMNGDRKD